MVNKRYKYGKERGIKEKLCPMSIENILIQSISLAAPTHVHTPAYSPKQTLFF